MTIDNFQARFAFVDKDGRLTTEALRALRGWFERIGGFDGSSTEDLLLLNSFSTSPNADLRNAVDDIQKSQSYDYGAIIAELSKKVGDLQSQIALVNSVQSEVSELKKYAQDLDVKYSFVVPLTDWEHPGKIGSKTASTGAFSTLTATTLNGNTFTTGSSTYTGTAAQTYTFPTTSATIARTDAANTFTGVQTINGGGVTTSVTVTSTGGDSPGLLTLQSSSGVGVKLLPSSGTGGYNWVWSASYLLGNTWELIPSTASGGSTFSSAVLTASASSGNVGIPVGALTVKGSFGCNDQPAQSAYALGAACTDLATAVALANSLRLMSIANGTGS